MSQNLTVEDLSYLESLYDQFDEAQQITVSLDLNTMLRQTPLMAIPDEDYQMLLNRESSCAAGENLYISQDPGFAQTQTVQIENLYLLDLSSSKSAPAKKMTMADTRQKTADLRS